MKIKIISAMGLNNGIGLNNKLPWGNLKDDMAFFRKKTINKNIVMGYNTYKSIGFKPLPKRTNIVLSKTVPKIEGCLVYPSKEDFISEHIHSKDSYYIIGGSQIYNLFITEAAVLYLSILEDNYFCDTFFPKIDLNLYSEIKSEQFLKNDRNESNFKIVKLRKNEKTTA